MTRRQQGLVGRRRRRGQPAQCAQHQCPADLDIGQQQDIPAGPRGVERPVEMPQRRLGTLQQQLGPAQPHGDVRALPELPVDQPVDQIRRRARVRPGGFERAGERLGHGEQTLRGRGEGA